MKPASATVCIAVLGVFWAGVVCGQDAFQRRRDDEAERVQSRGFSIAFADARRAFHPSEVITLTFAFTRQDISPHNYDHCGGLGLAEAIFDARAGVVVDPQRDLWNNGLRVPICGVLSGIRGGVVGADGRPHEPPPITFAVYLNQGARIDQPGTYRFYVTSHHAFGREPLVSNILEFQIVKPDADWDRATFEDSLRRVNEAGNADAARALAYLGSHRAIEEIARRFDSVPPGTSTRIETDQQFGGLWLRGLYGAPDRGFVVSEMHRQLDRAERHVSSTFVSQLTMLELTWRTPIGPISRASYLAQYRMNAGRWFAALKRAGTLQKYLSRTFADARDSVFPNEGLLGACRDFADDTEGALMVLAPVAQRALLTTNRNWNVFRDPVFLPMLRRLIARPERGGPQDIALRLLYEMAPAEGRRIVMRELARPETPIGIEGFEVIADGEVPALDEVFARRLEMATTVSEYRRAVDIIERFASPRIFPRVQSVFERFAPARACASAPTTLAYFYRVAPEYARAQIRSVAEQIFQSGSCDTGILPAIARRRITAALEQTAIEFVHEADGRVADDAVRMLKAYGSERAAHVLWDGFARWHRRWETRVTQLEAHWASRDGVPWDAYLEEDLREALTEGTAWLNDTASLHKIAALCLSARCKSMMNSGSERLEGDTLITVVPPNLPDGEPQFFVAARTYALLPSRAALRRWIALHAAGTAFVWEAGKHARLPGGLTVDYVEPGEYFEGMRSYAEARGMTLTARPYAWP